MMKTSEQPKIDASLRLLESGYEHDGLLLDLYGENDEEAILVYQVALTGDKRAITTLFADMELYEMGAWCERQAVIAGQEARLDAAIDRAEDRKYNNEEVM